MDLAAYEESKVELAGVLRTASALLPNDKAECHRRIRELQSFQFLSPFQYELSINPKTQRDHAEHGGFCSLHTWQYESIASPQGTCSRYPALLNHLASSLAKAAATKFGPEAARSSIGQLLATAATCPLWRLRTKLEAEAIAAVDHKLAEEVAQQLSSLSAICLPHLRLLVRSLTNVGTIKQLLEREAMLLQRIAEDMQRYGLKHEALRRHLASDEERDAALKALLSLVGHRSVSSPWRVEYLL